VEERVGVLRLRHPFGCAEGMATLWMTVQMGVWMTMPMGGLGDYYENLVGLKGVRSWVGGAPVIASAMTCAVIGARRMPSRKWPVAT
jgi:hypothetical protein